MPPAPKTATFIVSPPSDPFDGHRDRTAATEAERGEAEPAVAPDQFVGERRDDPGATRPDRVTERDRAAVDVDLVPIEPQGTPVGEGLGGERLVDLDQVEGLDRHLDPVEE